jgi:imidazoleglycerol-phosphate dehydratase
MRYTVVERETSETKIKIRLNLDGKGIHKIQTGIGFFDHMLIQLTVHGLFDLEIDASGDVQVDNHHTVEDVALTLGQAFDQALKDKRGLVRMGQAVVPMDESLCEVIVDLSGRPYSVFTGDWNSFSVGDLPVSLIEHFFYSLSMSMKANLHAHIRYGRDDHHKTEGLFKALGRALNVATRIETRRSDDIPSSKGVL